MATTYQASFVSDEEAAVFACGGYLKRLVVPNLSIINLNTVIWSLKHTPKVELAGADAFGQHAWLEAQLEEARLNGDKVYITGHIPPMLQSYTGGLGSPLWDPTHLERYSATVGRYRDVVASQLFGHVHSNEIRAVADSDDDAPPMLVLGSISPCYTNTPFFNVVLYDRGESKYPRDVVTYQLDISAHVNETIASSSTSPDAVVELWDRMFDNLTSHLGMEALTNSETRLLSKRMVEDGETFNAYFNDWYKGVVQEACESGGGIAGCHRKEACLVACGSTNETWQACLVDDDRICTLGEASTSAGGTRRRELPSQGENGREEGSGGGGSSSGSASAVLSSSGQLLLLAVLAASCAML